MKRARKPDIAYRLSLRANAMRALVAAEVKPFRYMPLGLRPDGGCDLLVSFSVADQLMTAARERENLSDTLLRTILTKA